jgi:hypothetical protein
VRYLQESSPDSKPFRKKDEEEKKAGTFISSNRSSFSDEEVKATVTQEGEEK